MHTHTHTHTHTHARTYWTAVWFLFGVINMQFKKALWLQKSAHMYTKFHLLLGPNFIHDISQTFVNVCKNICLKLYYTC